GQGYAVLGASNGASGLRLVEQHQCDVILLDLALPELPGLELLQQLKVMDRTREIPVIVLGASPDEQPGTAEGCVPRPLEQARVMTEVARCVSAGRTQRPVTEKSSRERRGRTQPRPAWFCARSNCVGYVQTQRDDRSPGWNADRIPRGRSRTGPVRKGALTPD